MGTWEVTEWKINGRSGELNDEARGGRRVRNMEVKGFGRRRRGRGGEGKRRGAES